MTKLISLLFLISTLSCSGQTSRITFVNDSYEEQIVNYTPVNSGQAEEKYKNALILLEETKKRIEKNNNKFDVADYWNLLVVLNELNETENNLIVAFEKLNAADGSCDYLTSFQKTFKSFPFVIEQKLTNAANICLGKATPAFNMDNYIESNNLDKSLVMLINTIGINDQKYRTDNTRQKEQRKLDSLNQNSIDSLYMKHRQYLGKTLVGEKFQNVMWQVIQHSNLSYMEKYLPVIQEAVDKQEIQQGSLKYLLDRIASEKTGVQYFGSQVNVPFADREVIENIKKKYKIE